MSINISSQINVFLQACTILVISCILLKIIDGQEWPVIVDPFPDDEIIVGPEQPVDCTLACQQRIDDALALIAQVQQQLTDTNTTLSNRVSYLEANMNNGDGGGGTTDYVLTQRVNNLELNLPANVTTLTTKINTDINSLRTQLMNEIALLRQDLEYKINNLPPGGGGGDNGAKATEVYVNVTQRINNLENTKIQNLISDNNLWRQNFRIVNSTFAKIKKSAYSNNVVLNG